MQDTISRTPGLYDFRDAQLYVSAKGTKLQFKPAQTVSDLLGAIENFCEYAEQTLDMEHPLASAVDALRGPYYLLVALFSSSILVCSPSVRRHIGCGRDRDPSWPSAVCRCRAARSIPSARAQVSVQWQQESQTTVQSSPPLCFVAPAAPEHQSRGAEPGQGCE